MLRAVLGVLLSLLMVLPAAAEEAAPQGQSPALDIARTVVKMPLAEGVSMDDAVDSMKLRANQLNLMLVAEQPLYKQVRAMGQEARRIEIFQFCDPLVAKQMVEANLDFAAYMPCRIALVEDEQGKGWLVMMDLDVFIGGTHLSPELQALAIDVRDKLTNIMTAGAQGEL
jgi:uncharacterized protein (DUF302 family)